MTDIVDQPSTDVAAERVAVASQWQLMWWAFRRHRLAMVGLVVTIAALHRRAVPGFFAVNDPSQQNAPRRLSSAAGDPFHRHRRGRRLVVPALSSIPMRLTRDPHDARRRSTRQDPSRKISSAVLRRGLRIQRARPVHDEHAPLRLRRTRASRCSCSAPTGSAAASTAASCRARRSRCRSASSASSCRCCIGVVLGGISGYYGGRIDFAIQRVIEFVLSLPTIPIWLALAAALPQDWPATLQLFHDHRDPVADRLGAARPRRARPLPVAAHRGVRHGRAARRRVRRGASSSATCCRASRATSSRRSRWRSRR